MKKVFKIFPAALFALLSAFILTNIVKFGVDKAAQEENIYPANGVSIFTDTNPAGDDSKKEKAFRDYTASTVISIIKSSYPVSDVIIYTEANPVQANVIIQDVNSLLPQQEEWMEGLILGAFPDSEIEFTYSGDIETGRSEMEAPFAGGEEP